MKINKSSSPAPVEVGPALPTAPAQDCGQAAAQARASYAKQAGRDVEEVRDSGHKPLDYSAWIDQFAPWRGIEARQAIQATLNRLAWVEQDAREAGQPLEIQGITPTILYLKKFVANRDISDKQLVEMSHVSLDKLATPPEQRRKVVKEFPNYEQQPSHRMAVALLSAICDIPYDQLSRACPDLGFSGTAGTRLWRPGDGIMEHLTPDFVASTEDFELANVLHDTTDSLEQAGVTGINKAVWGVDGSVGSAAWSVIRTLFEDPDQ